MTEPIETVAEHCQHEDCAYRRLFRKNLPYCAYAAYEHQTRGCPISECNRYKPGKFKVSPVEKLLYEGKEYGVL